MTRFLKPRLLLLLVFLGCAGLIAFGLVLQYVENLEPCPMCIIQRYAFVVAGLIGLVGALHGPVGWGSRVYGALLALTALGGGSVAARQSWIQHFPPVVLECGPDLEYMVNGFPLGDALPMIFKGTGDCSKVLWRFLGLGIPEWALLCFAGLLAVGLFVMLAKRGGASLSTLDSRLSTEK
ncbi:MAG: disulfide bond formation protein B [Rhodocyclaceae bacterium]|nr:disulfide bond formation protein B [Rhodocyclaceae bacterium]